MISAQRRLAALYLATFLLTIAPWYAANYAETGRLLATRNLQNIFVEEFYGGPNADRMPAEGLTSLPQLLAHDPLFFVGLYLKNIPKHMWLDGIDLLRTALSILFVLGLVLVWILSALLAGIEFTEIDPRTISDDNPEGGPIRILNLLTGPALAEFLANMVKTFTGFKPLGLWPGV